MSKPSQVTNAIRIMWAMLILGGFIVLVPVMIAILASQGVKVIELIPTFMLIAILSLIALLIRAVSSGRNWARLVYAVFAIIAILAVGRTLMLSPEFDLTHGVIQVVVITLYVLVLYLLFHPASNQWFKTSNTSAS